MDFNELSFDRLGSWPIAVRAIFLAGTFFTILLLGHFLFIKPRLDTLKRAERQQQAIEVQFKIKKPQAAEMPRYEAQLTQLKKTIDTLNRQLTDRSEIPKTIETLSKLAIDNRLEINAIKPEQENIKEFYTTIPIHISVIGKYHSLTVFIRQVEALQKIMTFNDFSIAAINNKPNENSESTLLVMNAIAAVYIPVTIEEA